MWALKRRGDAAVIHALRGEPSNCRIDDEVQKKAVGILSQEVYRGFRPTFAREHLSRHEIEVSRETVRKWMTEAKLWRPRRQSVEQVHLWRPRRSRYGELVQWDSSEYDWLEGRGAQMKLILMIDDATSKWFARFVSRDSTEENMALLERYLRSHGRPVAFYTDKASLFQTAVKTKRDEQGHGKDKPEMPPTQIGRALQELGIGWIAAHSPQAKGRVERSFQTAQDRLVKGMRVAGIRTLEQANEYLEKEFLPWCDIALQVTAASPDNAHRPLEKEHDLAAILSHVESRRVASDYTVQFESKLYQIDRKDICAGLRGGQLRVEKRRDGTVAMRFQQRYLTVSECPLRRKEAQPSTRVPTTAAARQARVASKWNQNFDLHKAPKIWQAARASGQRSGEMS